MWWRDLAVVGLATAASARRLRHRQLEPYDGNATEPAVTAVVYETATVVTTEASPATDGSPATYGTDATSDASIIVAPVPYSSPQPDLPNYGTTTTTTAIEYATGGTTVVATVPAASPYTSQQYSYAGPPAGSGTAPSDYSPPGTTTTATYYETAPTAPTAPTSPNPTSYPTTASNATCSGATLNVLDASLDWWYTKTLYYAVSTFSIQFNRNDSSTGWTLLPATTTFDVQSALAEPDCTSTPTFISRLNATRYRESCTPAASPVAAETTIITQTAHKTPRYETGNGTLPPLVVTPKPASISVADATQQPYAQGTPFVFFSEYEIVSKNPTTYANGSAGCAEATQTYTMDQAFSFEYTGADVNGSLLVNEGVVGDVNPALLGLVGQETAVAGSWVAEPTVVLLMQEVFVAQAALAATLEPTASFLDTPSPTRPPYVTLAPTGSDGPPKITYSPHVEVTQTALDLPTRVGDDTKQTGAAEQEQGGSNGGGDGDGGGNSGGDGQQNNGGSSSEDDDNGGRPFPSLVAFIAHIAQSDVTLQVPAAPTQNVITTAFEGATVTATRLGAMQGDNDAAGGAGAAGGVGGLIGAINTVAQQQGPPPPTNALDVLSQAEATFPGSDPTANAIINGLGGPAENGGGGGSAQAQEDNVPSGGGGEGGSRAITVGGAVITPNPQGAYDLGSGATLTPGGTAVVDGTTISLDSAGSAVVVNGVTQTLASQGQATGQDGSGQSGSGSGQAGSGSGQSGSGSGQSGSGSGQAGSGSGSGQSGPAIPLIAVGGGAAAITPNAATEYSIAPGATLTPGGSVVVSGTTMSLDEAATALVVDGITRNVASPTGSAAGVEMFPVDGVAPAGTAAGGSGTTMAPVLTIGGQTYYATNGGTTYVIDGETLTMGEEETVTIDGTAYQVSLAPSATRLVVDTEDASGRVTASSTQTLFPEQGSGAGASATTSSQADGPEQQVGNTASSTSVLHWSGISFALGSLVLAIWL